VNWVTDNSLDLLGAISGTVAAAGLGGAVALALTFAVGSLILAPRPVLSFVAGLSFGFAGLPLALVSATLGAALAFWISRQFAQPVVARYLSTRPKLLAVADAVDEEGWRAVLLLRLGPVVPSSLQSYFFGATSVSLWPYLAATLIGISPGVVVQVSAGALSRTALESTLQPWNACVMVIGLAASALVAVLISHRARRLLMRDSRPRIRVQGTLEP
jgi:uncharacterized membrane protein YdjX (TVP38/TMEM64 family)